MEIASGIILYNPNINNLAKSIKEIEKFSDIIILVDNNSNNSNEINNLVKENEKIKYIKNNENLGIATALNQLIDYANSKKIKYLLTLDQDSIFESKMFDNMLKYVYEDDVALICPMIVDINKKKNKNQKEEILDIKRCITSGTLMILDQCNKIGKFDEKMFIDYVDFDYCKRVKIKNKRIIRVKDSILKHEIGKRSNKKIIFWNVYPTNHTSNRIYYYTRNIKYYLKKHKQNLSLREKIKEYIYLLWKFISIILYEKEKIEKLKMYFKGLKEVKDMIIL